MWCRRNALPEKVVRDAGVITTEPEYLVRDQDRGVRRYVERSKRDEIGGH